MTISNVKSRGSLDAVQPVQPVARAENDLNRRESQDPPVDTGVISEPARLKSEEARVNPELLRLEALHEIEHTDGLVRRYMDEERNK